MHSSDRPRPPRGAHLRITKSGRFRRAAVVGSVLALTMSMSSYHYVVQPGDTLSEIARDLGMSMKKLADMNGIEDPDHIRPGTELRTDGAESDEGSNDDSPSGQKYTVKPGDTLGDIAWEFGVAAALLRKANDLEDADLIIVGMTLVIPTQGGGDDGSSNESGGDGDSTEIGEIFGYHVVQPGETLRGIALHYGITVDAIIAANGITNPELVYEGTRLALAEEVDSGSDEGSHGETHIVQGGETLLEIALNYGVSVSALIEVNDLSNGDIIRVGQELIIPEGGEEDNSEEGGGGGSIGDIVCPVSGADYSNDWGFPRSGGRYHQGNDLFAPAGTPVVAPVSGNAVLLTGSIGGKQYTLYGDDGNTYWGTHLGDFGNSGSVNAGDLLGYVGSSGNAVGTPPHLHFEIHPGGGSATNPYPTLVANGC